MLLDPIRIVMRGIKGTTLIKKKTITKSGGRHETNSAIHRY